MSANRAIWVGHCRTGGRFYLKPDELLPGINVLGQGADDLAAVLACACSEAGLRTLVLDFHGRLTERLSGRFESRGFGYFLYDSERMEERASLHAELAAERHLRFDLEKNEFPTIFMRSIERSMRNVKGIR